MLYILLVVAVALLGIIRGIWLPCQIVLGISAARCLVESILAYPIWGYRGESDKDLRDLISKARIFFVATTLLSIAILTCLFIQPLAAVVLYAVLAVIVYAYRKRVVAFAKAHSDLV